MLYLWINIPYWLFIQKGNNLMTLKEWMDKEGLNDRQAAEVIGIRNINPSTNINRYKSFKRIPQKKVMKMIYIATKGKVQPNDFYDLKV